MAADDEFYGTTRTVLRIHRSRLRCRQRERDRTLEVLWCEKGLHATHLQPRNEPVAVRIELHEHILHAIRSHDSRSGDGPARCGMTHGANIDRCTLRERKGGAHTLVWYLPSREIRVENLWTNCASSRPPGRSRLFCEAMLCSSSKLSAPF